MAFISHLHYAKVTLFICTEGLPSRCSMEGCFMVKDSFSAFIRTMYMQGLTDKQYLRYITTQDYSGISGIIFLLVVAFRLLFLPILIVVLHMAFFATLVSCTPKPWLGSAKTHAMALNTLLLLILWFSVTNTWLLYVPKTFLLVPSLRMLLLTLSRISTPLGTELFTLTMKVSQLYGKDPSNKNACNWSSIVTFILHSSQLVNHILEIVQVFYYTQTILVLHINELFDLEGFLLGSLLLEQQLNLSPKLSWALFSLHTWWKTLSCTHCLIVPIVLWFIYSIRHRACSRAWQHHL